MSDDIIARLRSAEPYDYGGSGVVVGWLKDDPTEEAAEEIERLRARVEQLEREMRYIGRLDYPPTRMAARDRARAALTP